MLIKKFNFSLARFSSIDEIDWAEVEQADIIQVRGKHSYGIYHSEHASWRGKLEGFERPEQVIKSKRERKKFAKSLKFFEDLGMKVKIVKMDEKLFKEFEKLYKDTTLVRERPLRFDLKSQVLGKIKVNQPIYLVGLFEGNKLNSGLIFSVFNKKVMVSFGAKHKFKTRGGAGGMLEYELAKYCLEHGLTEVSHGSSTNPLGLYSKSGIFEFKARYGYTCYPVGAWYSTYIKNPKVSLSDFVFVGLVDNEIGYTVVSEGNKKDLITKYKTREITNIKVFSLKQAVSRYQSFVKKYKEPK